jgi:hypothetical protein
LALKKTVNAPATTSKIEAAAKYRGHSLILEEGEGGGVSRCFSLCESLFHASSEGREFSASRLLAIIFSKLSKLLIEL